MNKNNRRVENLWPIVEGDDRFPLPPAVWTVINVVLAFLITLPFLFVLGVTTACLWGVNGLHTMLLTQFTHHAMALSIGANGLKVLAVLFAFRMEYLMVDFVPFLVREARDGLRECPDFPKG